MATPEYANELYSQALPYKNPQHQPKENPNAQPQIEEPKKNARIFTKVEKMMVGMISVLAVLLFFGSLFTQVILSNQNRNYQDLQNVTSTIAIENTNLEQEVQELSRYNRIIDLAEEMGLEMNEANVRNVTK